MVQGAITIDICKDPNDLTYVFDNLVFVCLIKGLGLLAKRFAHIMPTYYLGQNSLPLHHECLADDSVKMLQKDLYVLTSVPKISIPSAVVYYYCAWYTYFHNGRYN